MQVLSFVNTSGPEPWKNGDAKRFVRSHAMKDYRRKQREHQKKKKKQIVDHSQPGESSFAIASTLPDQENAQVSALPATSGTPNIPSPASSVERYTGRKGSPPGMSQSLQDFLGRAAAFPNTCSILPQIFPLEDALECRLPSPSPSSSSSDSPGRSLSTAGSISQSPSQNFDLSICMTVYGALDATGANFDYFTKHYFRSVHSYLTILHRPRFLKCVYALSKKAHAEVAVLLLCVRICAEPSKSDIASGGGKLYRTAKKLFHSILAYKGASLELVQAGSLLALFEHNADLNGTDYETLQECAKMAAALGLNAVPRDSNTVHDEERRRAYWGLLSLDCTIALHDEKHERQLVFQVPSPDDILPSLSDTDFDSAVDEMPSASTSFIVQSKLPNWTDSFCRQGQSVRLMYMVQKILREKFDNSPDLMVSRIEHLDNLIVSGLGRLLADCSGKCTQYCGPISFLISASFLLHEYQLLSTMHNTSQKAYDTQASTRSKLAIETMIDMMVNILREFPVTHTPELSPAALFSPYQAAMLGLLLDRISGLRRQPTLVGTTFDLMVNGLKHFSTVWPCTAEYIRTIRRAQSRALPMPLPCVG